MADYFTIKVPRRLANRITELAVDRGVYRSVSEFVVESARRRLDNFENLEMQMKSIDR